MTGHDAENSAAHDPAHDAANAPASDAANDARLNGPRDMDDADAGTPASRLVLLATDDPRPVHFVGIAGAGMSALAELLVRRGVAVQGTDANPAGAPDLAALGVRVSAHDAAMVAHARALVYSSAISPPTGNGGCARGRHSHHPSRGSAGRCGEWRNAHRRGARMARPPPP